MSKELIIEEILSDGHKEIGRLVDGEISIGRDEADGVTVDNSAVSRNHGKFFKARNHWFYQDMGSTNGSWRNGKQIKEGQITLVRPGDVLQMADTPLRVSSQGQQAGVGGFPQFASSTLIVFRDGAFADEFPLPEFGRALVLGGSQADLPLTEAIDELPRLVVEKRGEKVCAFAVAEGPAISLNDAPVGETVTLEDGDLLKVAAYTILFNDHKPTAHVGMGAQLGTQPMQQPMQPHQQAAMQQSAGGMMAGGGMTAGDTIDRPLKEWDDSGRQHKASMDMVSSTASGRFTFGRTDPEDEMERTVAIDPADMEAKMAGYNMHPSSRYHHNQPGSTLGSLEDKLIVLIGFLLLLCLIGLVVWYVFLT